MSKITFKSGSMGSAKSLDLLATAFNYQERGLKTAIFKPKVDLADGSEECLVKTRVPGIEPLKATWVDEQTDIVSCISDDCSIIIVEESQFLTKEIVDKFQKICYNKDIPIIFYGLRNNFKGELFEGSKRIFEICDKFEELKAMCSCGSIARQNARLINGKVVKEGEEIGLKNEVQYVSVCNKCFYKGEII